MSGMVLMNDTDIWETYGVFLSEEKEGGMDNLTELLTPSKVKTDVSVNIREQHGEKYAQKLVPRNEPRDVTLCFALYADTRAQWLQRYFGFVNFLKEGNDGWIDLKLPTIDLTLRLKYTDSTKFTPLTYLWQEGVHAGRFKVRFREPVPVI